ncbi:hypothetical protein WMF20_49490 [Sorangium sp. So ce834]|uniref:hypothetical protein n=1 Tax=Sorangium sp. So ce834 TaxID=3133321 RepID=UPI003F5DF182
MLMVGLALVACGDDGEEGNSGPGGTSSTSGTGGADGTGGNGGTDGTGGNGGTDGTGGNGGETGGDLDDKQLGDLTDAEAQAVCDALAASAADITKEDGCELFGLIAAATPGSGLDCETAKEQCMNEPEEPAEEGMCPTEDFAGCTATVAEFKACTNRQLETVKALTCESDLASVETPPECEAIGEKCPELAGGGDTGGEEP